MHVLTSFTKVTMSQTFLQLFLHISHLPTHFDSMCRHRPGSFVAFAYGATSGMSPRAGLHDATSIASIPNLHPTPTSWNLTSNNMNNTNTSSKIDFHRSTLLGDNYPLMKLRNPSHNVTVEAAMGSGVGASSAGAGSSIILRLHVLTFNMG